MAALERTDPFQGFRFAVEIEGVTTGWFTECTGLSVERQTEPYKEGGVNDYIHHLPGPVKRFNITLKQGVVDYKLWTWLREGLYDGRVARHNLSIVLYSDNLTEAKRWNLTGAYPTKWSGSTLDSANNEALVDTLELVQDEGAALAGDGGGAIQRALAEETAGQAPELDLSALAQKVYILLKQELKVEQARRGKRLLW
jgi:phage tail-like protein